MSFDLNAAHETPVNTGQTYTQYIKPGITENVKVVEVILTETQKNKVPYMELQLAGPNGELGRSNKMFFGTEVKPGNKTSGWGITARNIKDLIVATHNVDELAAKAMIANVPSKEEVVSKVSSILVGKPFRGKFIGQEGSNGKIYASLDRVESMQVVPTKLKFNEAVDIRKYEPYVPEAAGNNKEEVKSDLPF